MARGSLNGRAIPNLASPHSSVQQRGSCDLPNSPTQKNHHSMRKPKVQPPIPLILRSLQIHLLLLPRHTLPNRISLPINIHIIHLRPNKQHKIIRTKRNKDLIPPPIKRLIIVAVDILTDNTTRLDTHIVQRTRHRARAHCTSVARCDGDEDSVDIRVADEQG